MPKDYRDLTSRTVELTRIARSAQISDARVVFQIEGDANSSGKLRISESEFSREKFDTNETVSRAAASSIRWFPCIACLSLALLGSSRFLNDSIQLRSSVCMSNDFYVKRFY